MNKIMSIFLISLLGLPAFAEQGPVFLDIAKNDDGSVKYLNHQDAISYCGDHGAHLPSVRELAQLSMSLGAKGVAESKLDDSYQQIRVVTLVNGTSGTDSFYFSYAGYQPPAGDLAQTWIWSLSISRNGDDAGDRRVSAKVLEGLSGGIGQMSVNDYSAVKCVLDR